MTYPVYSAKTFTVKSSSYHSATDEDFYSSLAQMAGDDDDEEEVRTFDFFKYFFHDSFLLIYYVYLFLQDESMTEFDAKTLASSLAVSTVVLKGKTALGNAALWLFHLKTTPHPPSLLKRKMAKILLTPPKY